jgi:Acetoacetate decarboxylase (ADC)
LVKNDQIPHRAAKISVRSESTFDLSNLTGEASMVVGYTVPRTPLGVASLDPPPPWHYSGDVVGVEYWADPKAVAALLPEGISPDREANGRATMMFLDWQFTSANDEYLDPSRYQYREAFILVDAHWENQPVTFCPFIFVDNDAALARGWIQGFPKRMGTIFQTRTFEAPSPAAAPVCAGGKFGASVSSHGQRLADIRVTLREKIEDPTTIFNRPTALLRYFPTLVAGRQDKPAVNELTLSLTDNLSMVNLWTGDAELQMPEAKGEEFNSLKPIRIGRGFRYGLSYSVSDLKVLKDLR